MSRVGLDWYKREPVAYLGDVQGLTSKEHAVYSVVIDLLYVHGGTIRNDPKFISGWISDMGSSAVRKALTSLDANPRITIEITEGEISQNRAKTEAKTKQNLRETAQKHGKIGGEKSAELRRQNNKSNDLAAADPSTEIQPEKTRVDKISKRDTKVSTKKPPIKTLMVNMLCEIASKQVAQDFVDHRWAIKKPMTKQAAKMLVNKLRGNMNADAVLSLSIENGWPGVYPESSQLNGGHNGQRNSIGTPKGVERVDPALEQIARLAGLEVTPGNGGR